MMKPALTRRRLLAVTAAATVATATDLFPAATANSAPRHRDWTAATSTNKWPVVGRTHTAAFRVEGSDASATLLSGTGRRADATTVLLHVARRFSYNITTLTAQDIHAYTTNRAVLAPDESNRLSGTAILIKPAAYPLGTTGNLYPGEIAMIQRILAECDGLIAWNGDDPTHPSEGHFHLTVAPDDPRLARTATKIRSWRVLPDLAG